MTEPTQAQPDDAKTLADRIASATGMTVTLWYGDRGVREDWKAERDLILSKLRSPDAPTQALPEDRKALADRIAAESEVWFTRIIGEPGQPQKHYCITFSQAEHDLILSALRSPSAGDGLGGGDNLEKRQQVYLTTVEGWLRANRGMELAPASVDDLCARIAARIEELERNKEAFSNHMSLTLMVHYNRAILAEARAKRAESLAQDGVAHDLYKTGDADAPRYVKDHNDQVVLSMCRRCSRTESELIHACVPLVSVQAMFAPTPHPLNAGEQPIAANRFDTEPNAAAPAILHWHSTLMPPAGEQPIRDCEVTEEEIAIFAQRLWEMFGGYPKGNPASPQWHEVHDTIQEHWIERARALLRTGQEAGREK